MARDETVITPYSDGSHKLVRQLGMDALGPASRSM
jgi:hypothetical protein